MKRIQKHTEFRDTLNSCVIIDTWRDRIAIVHEVADKGACLSFPRDLLSRNMRYTMIYRSRENDIRHGAIVKLFKFVIQRTCALSWVESRIMRSFIAARTCEPRNRARV